MSLLIIAFSQADNKAIVISYNTGYSSKETKVSCGQALNKNQQDQSDMAAKGKLF